MPDEEIAEEPDEETDDEVTVGAAP